MLPPTQSQQSSITNQPASGTDAMSAASLDKRLARQVLDGDGSVEAALSLFEYREPRSFDHAVELVAEHGEPTPAAERALSRAWSHFHHRRYMPWH